jgi:hypothetical protein
VPLRDHFHPPLGTHRHWHAFHNAWVTYIAADLNRRLPPGYFAEGNVQFGIEINTDVVEILVFHGEGGPQLAGAVELVSPANKDRPAHRDAFVSKCAAYLQRGVGLAMVDVVTERDANLHDLLLERLAAATVATLGVPLYATAYRPVERDGRSDLDIWHEILAVGRPLPTLPLWLRGGICLPLELEVIYDRTCQEQRVPLNGA